MRAGSATTVACLAGDGIGPEVMAEASRALAAVSRPCTASRVDEQHVPFGGDALAASGHALPASTRAAVPARGCGSGRHDDGARARGRRRPSST